MKLCSEVKKPEQRGAALAALALTLGACSQHASKGTPPASSAVAAVESQPAASAEAAKGAINPRLLRRFVPLSAAAEVTKEGDPSSELVTLGRMLFYDPRLSKDNDLSCNSCHNLETYGVDNQRTSVGHNHKLGERNSPTVYNASVSFAQFWDGRAANVEEQAKGPIVNPAEMAMADGQKVVTVLKTIPGYVQAFHRSFPQEKDPITYDNTGKAIGAFERGLVTPGRWDKYLQGDEKALTEAEKAGLKTFLDVGCMVCHTGTLLGGSMFERVGVVEPWPNQSDKGRGRLTGVPAESMMFKVPTLRNVAKTAPYFHDGSGATLQEAIRMMGKHQLGLALNDDEIGSIATWLNSLTGELPAAYIAKPTLP